jgi:hypothetical protein
MRSIIRNPVKRTCLFPAKNTVIKSQKTRALNETDSPKIRDSNLISLPHALVRVFFCVGGERLVGNASVTACWRPIF